MTKAYYLTGNPSAFQVGTVINSEIVTLYYQKGLMKLNNALRREKSLKNLFVVVLEVDKFFEKSPSRGGIFNLKKNSASPVLQIVPADKFDTKKAFNEGIHSAAESIAQPIPVSESELESVEL